MYTVGRPSMVPCVSVGSGTGRGDPCDSVGGGTVD